MQHYEPKHIKIIRNVRTQSKLILNINKTSLNIVTGLPINFSVDQI